jgi:hypothetical protein
MSDQEKEQTKTKTQCQQNTEKELHLNPRANTPEQTMEDCIQALRNSDATKLLALALNPDGQLLCIQHHLSLQESTKAFLNFAHQKFGLSSEVCGLISAIIIADLEASQCHKN